MRFSRVVRSEGQKTASKLCAYAAVSLKKEIPTCWPLPLPSPLPQNANKQVLLLDIDETLIHTFGMTAHEKNLDDTLLEGVEFYEFHYLARPFLEDFLKEVNELFEVIFWTSGTASYCAAILDSIEQDILQLPPSFYAYRELVKDMKGLKGDEGSTSHANFYALSRTQTLESLAYMKYIPMAGRPLSSAVLIDDNVRSFPLTPRNGIKIPPFYADDRLIQNYLFSMQKLQQQQQQGEKLDEGLLASLQKGSSELNRLEKDTALRDIMPLLRAIAKVPHGEDVRRELDHWRSSDYTKCDDFRETMNLRSVTRNELLGEVLPSRNEEAIPPFKSQLYNSSYLEAANAEITALQTRPKPRSSKL